MNTEQGLTSPPTLCPAVRLQLRAHSQLLHEQVKRKRTLKVEPHRQKLIDYSNICLQLWGERAALRVLTEISRLMTASVLPHTRASAPGSPISTCDNRSADVWSSRCLNPPLSTACVTQPQNPVAMVSRFFPVPLGSMVHHPGTDHVLSCSSSIAHGANVCVSVCVRVCVQLLT